MHVRKNDIIQVTAGDDAGKTGKILYVMTKQNRVIVEGINFIQKHIKRSEKNPQGGRVQKEAPVSVSNVLVICQNKNCEKSGKGVRTRRKILENGEKSRVCYKCGSEIIASD
ncbi:MAG: 50S ribosomal protein L24 [Candidatus Scalindua rubra]|uniref:Large ribosomal subunit protein uL24 n=1 Tax=Candidatus Scalindua brodae TaxID=237368 RepID=A0A0B0EBX2_9BACT|nr:MAG: 50S ribosomal protein L24 [Candidatus Scalindua brodae]MBZ0110043.1 50S ribosomal protein L24 [Candidatus Scalindua rubra]TWU36891.1 50S ribosomal protein L24 [Candidatus Brocadiaceae bacterium S225]